LSLNNLEQFMAVFQVPEFIKPYLHHFVTAQEIELVTKMAGKSLTRGQISSLFENNPDMDELLEQAYQRYMIN